MGSLARAADRPTSANSNGIGGGVEKRFVISLNNRSILNYIPPLYPAITPYTDTAFSPTVIKQAYNVLSSRHHASYGIALPSSATELRVAKCIVIGDLAVGKTALVKRFCNGTFARDYKATIGVDFEVEKFQSLGISFNLQIWDTAGQERFRSIAAAYYRGADVIVIVFDMSDATTLTNCQRWLADALVGQSSSNSPPPIVFLVGTKTDLCSLETFQRVQTHAITVANAMRAELWTLSSKSGDNVELLFQRIALLSFCSSLAAESSDNDNAPLTPIWPAHSTRNNGGLIRLKRSDLFRRCFRPSRIRAAICGRLT